ncbi:MAG: outer membrane lipoprotein chaperone LolA [Magnetococcales bacterium]|nr:outer membrane lipoprotein chaperone LolA [Magnetococcales bacterium]
MQRFIDQLQSIEADFVQRIEENGIGGSRENRGHFLAAKPGKFRWDYQQPFKQLVLSNGQEIWYYEPDLRQVTRSTAKALYETPAAFLVSGVRLTEMFFWEIRDDNRWHTSAVHLKPKREDKSVQELAIALEPQSDRLLGLMVVDTMGHQSWFTFSNMHLNQPIDGQQFQFTLPAGVDVISE